MEAEQQINTYEIPNDEDLKQIIVATYRGQTQHIINQAQDILRVFSYENGFVQRVANLIQNCRPQEKDIKIAAANLLKTYSFDLSQSQGDKSNLIEALYNLIMHESLQINVKLLLGTGLQYQFNQQQNAQYKKIIKDKILQKFIREEAIAVFDSCIIIFNAYFNSITIESQQMFDFFTEIVQPISASALEIFQLILKMPRVKWILSQQIIVSKLQIFFQFISFALENLVDQSEEFDENLMMLRNNRFLISLFESYLLLFHNNHSIISTIYPSTNKLKLKITSAIGKLYLVYPCPEQMFHIIFLTVILQSTGYSKDGDAQNILINCLKILQSHLEYKFFINVFKQHQLDMIFSLLKYSVANEEQYQSIQSNPQSFAQLSQQYTEGLADCYHIKVAAGSTLLLFVQKIDEIPKIIVEIIMAIMSESIGAQDPNSQAIKIMQDQFSRYSFYRLNSQQKLQTCLMVLCVLSNIINKRQDLNKLIYQFFIKNVQIINNIQSPIVILRIIRTISYFPSAMYFIYIQMQMNKGKVFILEGVKSLQRILRINKFPQLFQFLSKIFINLIGVINVNDPIMQLIVINYYEKMLKTNPQLYAAVRTKIKQQFFINANKSKHATLICFNLLYSLIKNEKNINVLLLVQNQFYQISAFIQSEENKQLYDCYQQKLIEIHQTIMQKYNSINLEIQKFALSSLKNLHNKQKGSQIFRFYNNYLIKISHKIDGLRLFFHAFWQKTKQRFKLFLDGKQSLQAIPYFCFLLSQIISSVDEFMFNQQDLIVLIQMGQKMPKDQKQYPVIVFLTLLYYHPTNIIIFLKKRNIYTLFLNSIAKIKYEGKIFKKIFNLSYLNILKIEKDPTIIKQVLIQCVKNLKQSNQTIKNTHIYKTIQIKARPFDLERGTKNNDQVQFTRQIINDNQLINLFVKFKHPIENVSQFDQFKSQFWTYNQLMKDLQQPIKADLRLIMGTEMVDTSKARIIRKLRK